MYLENLQFIERSALHESKQIKFYLFWLILNHNSSIKPRPIKPSANFPVGN